MSSNLVNQYLLGVTVYKHLPQKATNNKTTIMLQVRIRRKLLWDRDWHTQNFFRSALRISACGRGGKEARWGRGKIWDAMWSELGSEPNATKNCEGGAVLQTSPALLWERQVFLFSNQLPLDAGYPSYYSKGFGRSGSFNQGHFQSSVQLRDFSSWVPVLQY